MKQHGSFLEITTSEIPENDNSSFFLGTEGKNTIVDLLDNDASDRLIKKYGMKLFKNMHSYNSPQ